MSELASKARTAWVLGLPNLWRALSYRIGIKLGLNPVRRIKANVPDGDFFRPPANLLDTPLQGKKHWVNNHWYFGWYEVASSQVPDWHLNPFSDQRVENPERPWWLIPDFDNNLGDIKAVWEASRFDWAIAFARDARSGDEEALCKLNSWLEDWVRHNPPYMGPHWKCGQEASIRVMHLAMAALMLGQHKQPQQTLTSMVKAHLQRIVPTLRYAIAQDNNHGTSEAAALYIGGSWLAGIGIKDGIAWQKLGCKWLENRAARLIEPDGSFSQYSVTYHRVMLDTYSMVEVWRRAWGLSVFSSQLNQRLRAATQWLYAMIQPENGDAPNLGANDGAHLLPLTDTDYRDFRPSVQLAMALFENKCAYPTTGERHLPLRLLGVTIPSAQTDPFSSVQFDNGGYSILRQGNAFVLFRYPRFRFRPSQADALHVDLWLAGENLLRDAGTYSYNAGNEVTYYFGGTASHNTVQFDGRDQMPRLGRFLFGDWLKAQKVQPIKNENGIMTAARYTDNEGASHHRQVQLQDNQLRVEDKINGFRQKAVLRWRLKPGNWKLKGNTLRNDKQTLTVSANIPFKRMALVEGWESRYYLKKNSLPVLEVEIDQPGTLVTEYRFQP